MPAIYLTAAAAGAAATAAAAASDCGQGLLVAPRQLAGTCAKLLDAAFPALKVSFIRSLGGHSPTCSL